jgi:excisionase family DNA binding protein
VDDAELLSHLAAMERRILAGLPPIPDAEPIAEKPAYLTAEEAAAYIRVHVETLRKWVRLGVFPHIPLPGAGKDYRFSRELIDEWARKRALISF